MTCINLPLLIPLHILYRAPAIIPTQIFKQWILRWIWDTMETECYVNTLSLLLRTAAYCGGTRTIWCGIVLCKGSHTLAGRFKLSVLSSATNWTVLLSFVGIVPSNLPIDINAWINSSSGASRGACKRVQFLHWCLFSSITTTVLFYKAITHIAETISFLASQIVHHTLAGIETGTAIVKRSTRAQVPKTYFIYYTFWRICKEKWHAH